MKHIIVAGAGKIGCLIALHLANTQDYCVTLIDKDFSQADSQRIKNKANITCLVLDLSDKQQVQTQFEKLNAVAIVSCLPYFCNKQLADYAQAFQWHYFDLTEDVATAKYIVQLAKDSQTVFMPRCGLAPGFIGLVAKHLSQQFDELKAIKLRVGALPINSNNALQYALTWSTDGLINEYANASEIIKNSAPFIVPSLEGLESIKIDGTSYEAFYTSGGIGNLADIFNGKVETMSYKTIRYPGHCEKIKFLMNDLLLTQDRETLKIILERAIPKTYQDVVIIYVSITGYKQGKLIESNYVNKIYPCCFYGYDWSAMQVTTASSVAAVIDIILADEKSYQGYQCQENIHFETFIQNRFGKIFQEA
ncbi:MAG: saccharopine dehydrogenase [Legionellales bacterium]|nr:saccharopine dehydrogenase [Legionellales bacterium]